LSNKHVNNGSCDKCEEIFDVYLGFYQPLKDWFLKTQAKVKDCHISQAGRGKADQEADFTAGKSKAHYGQSSHNYNAAVDIFQLTADGKAAWPRTLVQRQNWHRRLLQQLRSREEN